MPHHRPNHHRRHRQRHRNRPIQPKLITYTPPLLAIILTKVKEICAKDPRHECRRQINKPNHGNGAHTIAVRARARGEGKHGAGVALGDEVEGLYSKLLVVCVGEEMLGKGDARVGFRFVSARAGILSGVL
jgi:hypothetical protein